MRRLAILGLTAATLGCQAQDLSWPGASPAAALADYKESYYRDLGTNFTAALNWEQLRDELRDARVLYLGDHHRDAHLHDQLLDLLQRLERAGVRPALGLECVGKQDTALVDRYLAGEWTMQQLRRAMRARWAGAWLDDPDLDYSFYRGLLAMARQGRWPVFALEPTPRLPLLRRDEIIADSVQAAATIHPGRTLVVVVGQTHLLGRGDLVGRVGLSHVAIGANLSPALVAQVASMPNRDFLRSSSGVLFFRGSHVEAP